MALARLCMKVGKTGRAAPHAAYIAREGPYAHRQGRGERLTATEAGNLPAWAKADPNQFWLAADAHERANGSTYREMEIALPRELAAHQQIALVRDWVRQEIGARHAYQWAIHTPKAADGGEQPHVHLMFSERQRDGIDRDPEQYFRRYNAKAPERGGARKGYGPHAGQTQTRAERAADLKALRSRWESVCNRALLRAGVESAIDMRSHADAGRDDAPERKQLPGQWRGQGRADILTLREAKAEQATTERHLAQAVPDLAAEIRHQEAASRAPAPQRQAAPEHKKTPRPAASLPAAELVRQWDAERERLARSYRQRADRLESRLQGRIEALEGQRDRAQANHTDQRPKAPQGLFAGLRRGSWEKALAAWQETAGRIRHWKQARQADLQRRLKRIEGYLSQRPWNQPDRATDKAERRLARERPEQAARLPAARAEYQRQQDIARQTQQAQQTRGRVAQAFAKLAIRRLARAHGYTDSSRDWQRTPEALRRAIDDYNRQPEAVQQAVLARMRRDPQASQSIERLIGQRQQEKSRGIGR